MSPRVSMWVASLLVCIGALRFLTDTLHDLDPDYWRVFEGSGLRYVIRAPSDGTWLGWVNAQWFKVLSVPSGISAIYLRSRLGSGTAEQRQAEFRDWAVSGVWIAVFCMGFTVIEVQKQFGVLGLSTRLVAGEDPWLNHFAHILSSMLAWRLTRALSIAAPEPSRGGAGPA